MLYTVDQEFVMLPVGDFSRDTLFLNRVAYFWIGMLQKEYEEKVSYQL